MSTAAHYYELVKTRFGKAGIVWYEDKQGPRITRVLLPAPDEKTLREIRRMFPGAAEKSCRAAVSLGENLLAFTKGQAVSFDTMMLEMSRVPPFHKKVLRFLAGIPRGMVSTYGTVAMKTGAPGGARAAGQGCAKNPFPAVYPCHRVVRSDGALGGFGGGLTLKRALLEMEGVRFDKNGKVNREFIAP